MNCKQFNSIPLEEVLLSLGHLPTKENEKEAWYLNPFANESHASFKLDKRFNAWYLHSEGIGGNVLINGGFVRLLNWSDMITLFFKYIFSKCHITKQSFINLQSMSLM